MRSNAGFIEVTGRSTGKKHLINKSAIIFITRSEYGNEDENAVIVDRDGSGSLKIPTKETYKDISEDLLWDNDGSEEVADA